jgi:hypothetical protein
MVTMSDDELNTRRYVDSLNVTEEFERDFVNAVLDVSKSKSK